MNTHVLPSLIAVVGLVVLPSIFVQARDALRPGGHITLSCPPMQHFVEPRFEVRVFPPAKGSPLYHYTYSVAFGEKDIPLVHLRIKGLADTAVESWGGDFQECSIAGESKKTGQALSCWMKGLRESSPIGARWGTITLASPRAPGVGWYIAESATSSSLTDKLRTALLPFFHHDNALLTESLYDDIMEQCSSAQVIGAQNGRAMTGAVTVPFYEDPTATEPPVEYVTRDKLPDSLAEARAAIESSSAGRDARAKRAVSVIDSAGRWVVADSVSKVSTGNNAKGPHPLAPKVHLKDVTSACNVRALFVEVIAGDVVVDRRAIEIVGAKPCKFVQEFFKLNLPVSDSNYRL